MTYYNKFDRFDKEEFYKWMAILLIISTGVVALFVHFHKFYQR